MSPILTKRINAAGEALDFILEELNRRYGASFTGADELNPYDSEDGDVRVFSFDFAPEANRSKVFSATVQTRQDTGAVKGGVLTDWSQYLFRDRFLEPVNDVLSHVDGLAGWGANMTYARYDDRAWKETDYDAYVGNGASSDPRARVFLMVPKGLGQANLASLILTASSPLYELGINIEVLASYAGENPFPRWLYEQESSYIPASRRPGAPDYEAVLQGLVRADKNATARGRGANDSWDGSASTGNPDDSNYLPQITWNPGFGPRE
ncbi:hypothetical protein [uncultured Parolsenella sp.]|uniref:hypothetical protein n=1 Tax=uncultured Parolsenella sp. TaxID=2083008 RepID=UPI0027D962EA|nr:hypothetical protein [uncultured Parolsenella sp.]